MVMIVLNRLTWAYFATEGFPEEEYWLLTQSTPAITPLDYNTFKYVCYTMCTYAVVPDPLAPSTLTAMAVAFLAKPQVLDMTVPAQCVP